MSTPRHRFWRPAFAPILSCVTLTTALFALNASSDVPHAPPPPTAAPNNEQLLTRASRAFNEIARQAMPAVVAISTIRKAPVHPRHMPGHLPEAMPPGMGTPQGDPRMIGIGSGMFIRKDGMILTNSHVVEEAERVTVTLDEKHKVKAHVVGTDPKTDLAIIQIDGPKRDDYPTIGFGDSDQLREGDWAIAIGSPFGLNRSVSFGIISAKGRAQMGILDVEDFIQTDAAINPGSSGGPLLNATGELIGINTAIFSEGGGNMGIGFAIPSKIAKEISDAIITQGHVTRGWVGVMAQDLDPDLARFFKVPNTSGALVSEVAPEGPAGKAALKNGDVITKFDRHPIDGASSLKSMVGKAKSGNTVAIDYIRNGKPATLQLTVGEQARPRSHAQQAGQAALPRKVPPTLGLAVEDVPAEISQLLRLPKRNGTLVVGVNPGSPAFEAGLGLGDVILHANRVEVHGAKEFTQLSSELAAKVSQQDVAVLYIQRGPTERIFVPVKLRDNG